MAEITFNANMSVEAVIHKAIRELATDVQKQFGVTIDSVDIDWVRIKTVSGPTECALDRIRMQTSS